MNGIKEEEIKKEESEEVKEKERIEEELKSCLNEKEECLDGWKRAKAALLNYQKEEGERIREIVEYRELVIISEIFNIIDNLRIVKKEITDIQKEDAFIKGFLMIGDQLEGILKKMGIEEINSIGQKFNPNFHEAVESVATAGESEAIVEELLRGYLKNGKVLRPAKVKIIK